MFVIPRLILRRGQRYSFLTSRRSLFRQAFVQASADRFMAYGLAALDLRQAFLDLAQEPIVVVDQPLNRFTRERLRVGPSILSDAGELGLKVR